LAKGARTYVNILNDQLARQCSSNPLTGSKLGLGRSGKVAWEVIRGWMSRQHELYLLSVCGKLSVLLKDPLLRKGGNFTT
jgi:hypothetical protein